MMNLRGHGLEHVRAVRGWQSAIQRMRSRLQTYGAQTQSGDHVLDGTPDEATGTEHAIKLIFISSKFGM